MRKYISDITFDNSLYDRVYRCTVTTLFYYILFPVSLGLLKSGKIHITANSVSALN